MFEGLERQFRIYRLKEKARRAYLRWQGDGHGGRHIANIITGGRIDEHAREFNETMDKLAKIDPENPSARLPAGDEIAAGGAS